MNRLKNKSGNSSNSLINKYKEKQFINKSLHRYDQKKWLLDQKDVPQDSIVEILIQNAITKEIHRQSSLLDTGSTMTAISEKLANVIINTMGYTIMKTPRFLVETGSVEDAEYDGRHLTLIIVKPRSNGQLIKLRAFIMPSKSSFDLIIGIKDMKRLGYELCIVQPDVITFRNSGKVIDFHAFGNSDLIKRRYAPKAVMDKVRDSQFRSKAENIDKTRKISTAMKDEGIKSEDDETNIPNQERNYVTKRYKRKYEKFVFGKKANLGSYIDGQYILRIQADDMEYLPPEELFTKKINNYVIRDKSISDYTNKKWKRLQKRCLILRKNPYKNKRKLKLLDKKLLKDNLRNYKFHKETTDKIRNDIKTIIKDVHKRKGLFIASELKDILMQYQNRIATQKYDIGIIEGVEYEVKVKPGTKPICHRLRSFSPQVDEIAKETIEQLLKYDIIEPYTGPWGVNMNPIRNRDGSIRMAINYRAINQVTEVDSYPVDNAIDKLKEFNGPTVYSVFDIVKAFFNIKVAEDSKKYTAFRTKLGSFVFKRMPFGGVNCPAVWSRASNTIFKDCIDLIKYVDDLILASKASDGSTEDENHLHAISVFFETLKKNNVKIKLSKCAFFVHKVKFLGHIITPEGKQVDDGYIKRLLLFKHPTTLPELRSYLGAIEWIANHVWNMKYLMEPLRPLLKKINKYVWTDEHQKAFNRIQNAIQNAELLHHADFKKPFYIFTDASNHYYAGVLLQKRDDKYVTIDMYSRRFSEPQFKLHITSKELIAVTNSVAKWQKYLWGRRFIIHSDSENIKHLFKLVRLKKTNNRRHYSWSLFLNEFNFDVVHVPGVQNKIADYLSRYIDMDKLAEWEEGNISLCTKKDERRIQLMKVKPPDGMTEHHYILYDNIKLDEKEMQFHKAYYLNLRSVPTNQRNRILLHAQREDDVYFNEIYGNFPNYCTINNEQMFMMMYTKRRLYTITRSKTKRKRRKGIKTNLNNKDVGDIIENAESNKMRRSLNKRNKRRFANRNRNKNRRRNTNTEHMRPNTINNSLENSNIPELEEISQSTDIDMGNVSEVDLDIDSSYRTDSDNESQDININTNIMNRNDESIVEVSEFDIVDRIYKKQLLNEIDSDVETIFDRNNLINNQKEDPYLNLIRGYLNGNDHEELWKSLVPTVRGDLRKNKYVIIDDLLYYLHRGKQLLVLPGEHMKAILEYTHSNILTGGHGGKDAMANEISKRFYWPGWNEDIKEHVNQCHSCSFGKAIPDRKQGKMVLFPAKCINDIVAIDHCGPYKQSIDNSYRYITTYYDRFSGYTVSVPASNIGAFTTAVNFVIHWVCKYGIPNKILTDIGGDFRSRIFNHLCKLLHTSHKFTTAYNPSTNGAVERFNRTLKSMMRCIAVDKNLNLGQEDHWHYYISYINAIHNNRISRRTGLAPAQIFLGRNMKMPIDFMLEDGLIFQKEEEVMYKNYIANMIRINKMAARQNLVIYDSRRMQAYEQDRHDVKYRIGQFVLYYKGRYPPHGGTFEINWTGPFKIVHMFNENKNVILMNVKDQDIIFTANVNRLTPYRFKRAYEFPSLNKEPTQDREVLELDNIITDEPVAAELDTTLTYDEEAITSEVFQGNISNDTNILTEIDRNTNTDIIEPEIQESNTNTIEQNIDNKEIDKENAVVQQPDKVDEQSGSSNISIETELNTESNTPIDITESDDQNEDIDLKESQETKGDPIRIELNKDESNRKRSYQEMIDEEELNHTRTDVINKINQTESEVSIHKTEEGLPVKKRRLKLQLMIQIYKRLF